jgi:hypothetical protein
MKSVYLIPLVLFTFIACTREPKSDQAMVGEVQESETTEDNEKYFIPAGNVIHWVGTKPTGRHNGTIRISKGYVSVLDTRIVGGKFEMDMKDIQILDLKSDPTNHDKLSNHLRSPDFFDVENFPTGEFEITSIEPLTDSIKVSDDREPGFTVSDPNYAVSGNLTLRGKTLGITFPARLDQKEDLLLISAAFNIDRTQWGISYRDETKVEGRIKDKFIHNTVNVRFDLEIEI